MRSALSSGLISLSAKFFLCPAPLMNDRPYKVVEFEITFGEVRCVCVCVCGWTLHSRRNNFKPMWPSLKFHISKQSSQNHEAPAALPLSFLTAQGCQLKWQEVSRRHMSVHTFALPRLLQSLGLIICTSTQKPTFAPTLVWHTGKTKVYHLLLRGVGANYPSERALERMQGLWVYYRVV